MAGTTENTKKVNEGWKDNAENRKDNADNQKDNSENRKDNSEKGDTASFEQYLKGISFPVDKKNLIKQAKEKQAPQDVLDTLNKLDEKEYSSTADVSKQMGRSE